jgi:hypothetical protein
MSSYSTDAAGQKAGYEVGVAVVPLSPERGGRGQEPGSGTVPGYEDLRGHGRGALLIRKGQQVVDATTEVLAAQIARSAAQIAQTINTNIGQSARSGQLDLESIDVSFGVTLTAGLQALFTAQGESSVQVTITLKRRAEAQ